MPRRSLTSEQVLTVLAEMPPRIAALTAGLAPAQLHITPNHDEWSANTARMGRMFPTTAGLATAHVV